MYKLCDDVKAVCVDRVITVPKIISIGENIVRPINTIRLIYWHFFKYGLLGLKSLSENIYTSEKVAGNHLPISLFYQIYTCD